MLKKILVIIVVLTWTVAGSTQTAKQWTLEDCIQYAERHSINLKQQSLSIEKLELDLKEAKWSFVPSLSLSSNITSSTGRVLDPTTYEFVQTNLSNNSSTSFSDDIVLFEGGRKIHTLNRVKLSLSAALLHEEAIQYNLKLNVIAAYMEELCAKEQISIAKESAKLVQEQLKRSQNLLEAGTITESDVLQLKSQLFAATNDISEARRFELMARLSLCDLLEIEDYASFEITESVAMDGITDELAIGDAIEKHPDYRISLLNQKVAESEYRIAKAKFYPSISLTSGYGSSWSDTRKRAIINHEGTYKYEVYPFFKQYMDNASAYVSLGIRIPILTGLSAKNSTKRAQIAIKEANNDTQEVYKTLRKTILQAQIDCDAAHEKFLHAIEEVRFAEEAYRQISEKYNLGTTDYLNWTTALVESIKANYSLAESKYTYLLKCEILKLYMFQ